MKKVELLSPAGNKESLIAAVNAGADAVYLGGSKFSARSYAANFGIRELEEVVDFCNLRDVKVYIAVNTLVKDGETEEFLSYISALRCMGVSALILQDLGMITLIHRYFPDMEVHVSTQMTVSTVDDVEFLKAFNIRRIVVSRELSISEIQTIKEATHVEIEAFVHGALCLCYSGKCYFSSMNGGRSGNRGACAQPCREEYESSRLEQGKYLLSPKDLNTVRELQKMIDGGVDSLKIEGRMKRMEYVFLVTRSYRRALDALQSGRKTDFADLDAQLSKVFNRSFTGGYILGNHGEAIINTLFQKPRGSEVAQVLGWDGRKKRLKIKLLDDLHKGDGLTIGEYVGRILKGKDVCTKAVKGEVVELDCIKEIASGTVLYKTYDEEFMSRLNQEMLQEKRLPLQMKIWLKKGSSPKIHCCLKRTFEEMEDVHVECNLSYEIEPAEKISLTKEKIRMQLSKTGEYPFYAEEIEIEMDDDIHLPIKILNELRRKALEELCQKKIASFKKDVQKIAFFRGGKQQCAAKNPGRCKAIRWSVKLSHYRQFRMILQHAAESMDRIYIDNLNLYHRIQADYPPFELIYCLPSVIKQADVQQVEQELEEVPQVMSASMGIVWKYPDKCRIVDYPLNLYNSVAHNFYHERGIETTMSIETLYSEQDRYESLLRPSMVEVPAYLYPRLMTSEYCPYKGSDGKCLAGSCQLPKMKIKNKKGESFFFRRDIGCKSVIYPNRPKVLSKEKIDDLVKQGYCRFRMELMEENEAQIRQLLASFGIMKKSRSERCVLDEKMDEKDEKSVDRSGVGDRCAGDSKDVFSNDIG